MSQLKPGSFDMPPAGGKNPPDQLCGGVFQKKAGAEGHAAPA